MCTVYRDTHTRPHFIRGARPWLDNRDTCSKVWAQQRKWTVGKFDQGNCLGQTVITVQALCLPGSWLANSNWHNDHPKTYETHIQNKDLIFQISEKSSLISHDMLLSGAVKCLASNRQICLCTIMQRAVFIVLLLNLKSFWKPSAMSMLAQPESKSTNQILWKFLINQ